MNYHNITTDDMNNGEGLRTVLWVAGCEHRCEGCQNPLTWHSKSGKHFDFYAEEEVLDKTREPHIAGLTLSGGDPLHPSNILMSYHLSKQTKVLFGKTVWLYTGYTWEEIMESPMKHASMKYVDVLVDGRFEKDKANVNYPWAGSTNQRVIDVQKSLKEGKVVLYG